MTELAALAGTYLLLAVCSFAPGYCFARRLKWNSTETACASIALSHLFIYLYATTVFLLHLDRAWFYGYSIVAVVLAVAARADLRIYFSHRETRRLFAGFGVLLAWGVVLMALIRTYSGGFWAGDYWEHHQRAQFFLHRFPTDHRFLGLYVLPARPPFTNLVTAFFLGQVGESYSVYQVVTQFLNLLVYFSLILMAGFVVRGGQRHIAPIVALLALSPSFQQNELFPWTKLHCCFFVFLGLGLYLRGWRTHDSRRMLAAVASLACAALVHYSSGPYLLFLAGHYLILVVRGTRPWWEPVAAAVIAGGLLATWFGWSIAMFGPAVTFGDNPTVTASAQLTPAENVEKVAKNTLRSLVPHPVYLPREVFEESFWQPSRIGYARDYWFLIYQTTLFPMMGLAGGLLILALVTRDLQRPTVPRAVRFFWAAFIPFCTLVGIAVNGGQELVGMAHVCLQPLAFLGLAYLGASLGRLPAWQRAVVVIGAGFDAAAGVLLQARMLMFSVEFLPDRRVVLSDQLPSIPTIGNGTDKAQYHVAFVGDLVGEVAPLLAVLLVVGVIAFLCALARAARPGGWWPFAVAAVIVAGVVVATRTEHARLDSTPDEPHLATALRLYAAGDVSGARAEIGAARVAVPSDPRVNYYFRLWSHLHDW